MKIPSSGYDLACCRRPHLIAGSPVNGHQFVLRSHSPARFGAAAAGWVGDRGRMGGDGLSRSWASLPSGGLATFMLLG
jgi:hypothetical protein